jgi:hypothetical protein
MNMKKKLFTLLVLLMTAVTGAVAQSYEAKVFDLPASWAEDETYISAADLPEDFVQITKDEAQALAVPEGGVYLIYGFNGDKVKLIVFFDGTYNTEGEALAPRGDFIELQSEGNNYIICYTAAASAAPAGPDDETAYTQGVELTDNGDGTWSLAATPAFDVELQMEYEPGFDLTKADGSEAHGTVAFTIGDETVTEAYSGEMVTVTVTPDEGYSTKDVTVRAYTSWESAARAFRAPSLVDDITVTKQQDGTWTFTMPEANVWVEVTYTKNLQDAWIEAIADQTYTGEALTPAITVKDGETTLTLNTDYTVAYANNTVVGEATVTVTGTGNYSGEATATFNIVKADITMTTAPAAASDLVYSGEAQTLITAGVASFGTVLYSTDGETYAEALPQGTDAGTYTVYYKVEGDDNHNAFAAQTVNVTIATNKTVLNEAITAAETYYNSISETNPDAAATLLEAINTAKGVQGNADATQSEIETAAQTLNDAVIAAQADVALKRVTIVIPAKSYVARVDADKRQIENAVTGVSLRTVADVTNSEVVLTDELNVVDAEMPYLIYNDNDEEKTISIVVSAENADNVQYDSEHFKGTLTAKTFTAEDMAAADHYVLSNGKDFVWVKDAGTLAAGKCWIELVSSSAAPARRLTIVFEGETTGINAINAAANIEGNCYDLSGRRVAQPKKGGLYIIRSAEGRLQGKNGRKVVIRSATQGDACQSKK